MTEPLQMIRAEISIRDFQRWMGMRRLQDPDHAMHCLLVESFGKDLAPRPFRVMTPRGGKNGCLYGYAHADADALREAAATFACPLQAGIIAANRIESKPMPSEWSEGKKLGFEVRVRPIVRPTRNADFRSGRECDVFQLEAEGHEKGKMSRSREQVYHEWLARQFDTRGGARLESATLQSFQRTRAIRKPRSRYSEGPDALMRGNLVIANGVAFANLLAQGVGRHRAYGYGMLLLRPAH